MMKSLEIALKPPYICIVIRQKYRITRKKIQFRYYPSVRKDLR